jgi:hypothetical protein
MSDQRTSDQRTSDQPTRGGFAGDPAAALTVAGSSGCCGNAAQTTDFLGSDPQKPAASASASACCGTQAEAKAEGSCCGTSAKIDAVAAGRDCCG